jgi:CheY-like chemotaxis protein
MPEMDGIGLGKSLREKHPLIPVILLSLIGEGSKKIESDVFISILSKPVKTGALYRAIQFAFEQKEVNVYNEEKVVNLLTPDFAEKYPFKILVAEDNPINQNFILRVLHKLGYKPDLAHNGRQALNMLNEEFYNLILMDVQMPELDGLETTRTIRKSHQRQPLIVALTANALTEDKENCMKAGMDGYITKPINLELLVNTMKDLYEKRINIIA